MLKKNITSCLKVFLCIQFIFIFFLINTNLVYSLAVKSGLSTVEIKLIKQQKTQEVEKTVSNIISLLNQGEKFEAIEQFKQFGNFQQSKALKFNYFICFIDSLNKHSVDEQILFLDMICEAFELITKETLVYLFYRKFLDGISAIFGIDEAGTEERSKRAKDVLRNVLNLKYTEKKQEIIKDILVTLKITNFHASGKHRFASLALAVVNMFYDRNIFSTEAIEGKDISELIHLLRNNLLYTVPQDRDLLLQYEQEWCPEYYPELILPKSDKKLDKKKLRWLDIGSAPKIKGAPTLGFLKQTFEELLPDREFEFFGDDIFFPHYNEETLEPIFQEFNKEKQKSVKYKDGVTYLNAEHDEYNVTSEKFNPGTEKFDFISLCKTFHHFEFSHEESEERDFAEGVLWIDQNENKIDAPKYMLTETQQRVVGNMLSVLNKGGYCFLELSRLNSKHRPKGSFNDDVFIIIRRVDETTYQIFDNVIPYTPEPKIVYPHYIDLVIEPVKDLVVKTLFSNPGILTIYPEARPFKVRLLELMRRSDILVFRYQKRDKAPWGTSILEMIEAVRQRKSIKEIYKEYLSEVPKDELKKQLILREIEVLSQRMVQFKEQRLLELKHFSEMYNVPIEELDTWLSEILDLIPSLKELSFPHDLEAYRDKDIQRFDTLFDVVTHNETGKNICHYFTRLDSEKLEQEKKKHERAWVLLFNPKISLDQVLKVFTEEQLLEPIPKEDKLKERAEREQPAGDAILKLALFNEYWEQKGLILPDSQGEKNSASIPMWLLHHACKEWAVIKGLLGVKQELSKEKQLLKLPDWALGVPYESNKRRILDMYFRSFGWSMEDFDEKDIRFIQYFLLLHDVGKFVLGKDEHEERSSKILKESLKKCSWWTEVEKDLFCRLVANKHNNIMNVYNNWGHAQDRFKETISYAKVNGISEKRMLNIFNLLVLFCVGEAVTSEHAGVLEQSRITQLFETPYPAVKQIIQDIYADETILVDIAA
jgi:hypothetical protein